MPPTYPTYEALKLTATPATASPSFHRLRWYLSNDAPSASIQILQDATNASSPQQSYTSTHPICKSALTEPPVSSIKVSVEVLNDYPSNWISAHQPHASPDDDENKALFDAEGRVSYCCNQHRPSAGPAIEISAPPGEFVTIGLFIDLVHPWLRELDSQIRAAKGVVKCWPLDGGMEMFVRPTVVSPLWVMDGEGWTGENWAYTWRQVAGIAVKTFERDVGVGRN